eukprot:CAMPEP_0184646616 /NCGR_PEP_ID=MMETSP0308-20130426/3351_1 /TAXON_ID=38269 /ORGANISM="Gloeochaete witrockiana, Strain SAG 46.84" /LENGTH=353 /DNA_ID=CAMNT_0027076803 /DNA_START=105 /DNA_END=1166 /DNA_ORIENTATION=+
MPPTRSKKPKAQDMEDDVEDAPEPVKIKGKKPKAQDMDGDEMPVPAKTRSKKSKAKDVDLEDIPEPAKTNGKKLRDYYEVLGLGKDATPSEIKKSYYKLALKVHPDRNSKNEKAHEEFLELSRAYNCLSNTEKRSVYDETGQDPELNEAVDDSFASWDEYFRSLYQKVTEEDIISYEKKYKHSPLEAEDVRHFYKIGKGDMAKVMDNVPLSTDGDENRFVEYLSACVSVGTLDAFPQSKVKKCSKCAKKKEKCSSHQDLIDGIEKSTKESSKENSAAEASLSNAIMAKRQTNLNKLADDLLAKYGGDSGSGKKGKKATKAEAMPTDEEFEAIQKEILARGKQGEEPQKKKSKR